MVRLRHGIFFIALGFGPLACGGSDPDYPDESSADAGGPVDECTEAAPCTLMPGMQAVGYLAEVGDQDPYVFSVSAQGTIIRIQIANDATFSSAQLELALLGPSGSAVATARAASTGRQQAIIQVAAPAAGQFALIVREVGSDGADRRNPYYLDLTLSDAQDLAEPNDTPAQATSVDGLGPLTGYIETQGDVDWMSFDLAATDLLEITPTALDGGPVRLVWALYAPDGTTKLAESTAPASGGTWATEIRAVGAAGRYYLTVKDDDDADADTDRAYVITLTRRTEPDTREGAGRNDTSATAVSVTAGESVVGYVASNADVDWYAIDVAAASTASPVLLSAELSYAGASPVDLQLNLFEPDGTTWVCDQRDGDSCLALRRVIDGSEGASSLATAHPLTRPGRYLISVRDAQDNEYDYGQSYTLRVDLPAEPDGRENYLSDSRSAAQLIPAATATTGTSIQYPWVEGYISYANDTDWYRFDIPGPVDASPGQNGDWLVRLELEVPGPTPVELNAFFFGPEGSGRESYRGLGKRCRDGSSGGSSSGQAEDLCQYPDAENAISEDYQTALGTSDGTCFVVFREVTGAGPHYWRMSDLGRDDFDLSAAGRYRFRMSLDAGCPGDSACAGDFLDGQGNDLCGRP